MHEVYFSLILFSELVDFCKGRVQKKEKKVWNFPYFSGVGGFEKVIFHKKNKKTRSKIPKIG